MKHTKILMECKMLLIALMRGKQNGNKNRKEIWTLLLSFLNDLDTTRGQEEKENKKEPPPLDKRRKKDAGSGAVGS